VRVVLLLALLLGLCPCALAQERVAPAPGESVSIAPHDLTDAHVRAAIDAIVAGLVAHKDAQRFWEPKKPPSGESTRQGGGTTALVVLSLLHGGLSYQDPRLRDAIEFLADHPMQGTYAVASRAQVWALLPPRFADRLDADARWLMGAFNPTSASWDYAANPRRSYRDNSLRQYGALGLWEAAKRGIAVDRRYWQTLEDALVEDQLADGGWNYTGDEKPPRGSMTAAGLTILFIAQDFLHAEDHLDPNADRRSPAEQALERGLRWMQEHFSPREHPGSPAYFYYYLYGVERVGLASGYRFFGEHDWFREGASELLRRLCRWSDAPPAMTIGERASGRAVSARQLAFALMFLSRGRAPVAFNKLRLATGAWNNRPRDAANLTAWLSSAVERELSWQIVDAETEPERWLDAAVLYLASDEAVPWADAPIAAGSAPARLRRYLDLGGLLLAVSEGNGRDFAESVERLGSRLYPHLQWRTLSRDHWAFTIHQPVQGRPPTLRALGNGVRDLIIVATRPDLARTYQAKDTRRSGAFQTAPNIYFYASEMKRPAPRLGRDVASAEDRSDESARTTVDDVRATHGGNWNPEPLALETFEPWLAASRGIDLRVTSHPLATIHRIEPAPALVLLQGIGTRALADVEAEAIESFVRGGGVLLVETPGGTGEFTPVIEPLIAGALGEIRPLGDTRIVTGDGLPGAEDAGRVTYRLFALQHMGGRETTPRLRGIVVDGQPRVIFSRDDISHALLDRPCWGVSGYSTESARTLMANLVQHAHASRNAASGGP
jgi:hypothetical protein